MATAIISERPQQGVEVANGDEIQIMPEPDFPYEVVNGQIVELSPMGVFQGSLATVLAQYLNAFALPRKLGLAVSEVLFNFGAGLPQRRLDDAFVPYSRWQAPAVPKTSAWKVVPSLAVEIVSDTNLAVEIRTRVEEYFQAGIELVWVIYPETPVIYVYTSPWDVRLLGINDELDGGNVLPGFRLKVAELFNALTMPGQS